MKPEILKTEILVIFYLAFKQAIEICNKNGAEIKIISEERVKLNYYSITLTSKNIIDFYNLGLKFGVLKSTI